MIVCPLYDNVIKTVSLYLQVNHVAKGEVNKQIVDDMVSALEDDLNTSLALTKILNQVKVLNQLFRQKDKDDQAISEAYQTLLAMVNVIGFVYEPRQLSDDELKLYQSWNDAKAKKDFQTADKIRDELIDKGII